MKSFMKTSFVFALVVLSACSTAPSSETGRRHLVEDASETLNRFKASDAGIKDKVNAAYGYAVFPSVGKGGAGLGGAYGHGVGYEQNNMVGYCDLSQATVGAQ